MIEMEKLNHFSLSLQKQEIDLSSAYRKETCTIYVEKDTSKYNVNPSCTGGSLFSLLIKPNLVIDSLCDLASQS